MRECLYVRAARGRLARDASGSRRRTTAPPNHCGAWLVGWCAGGRSGFGLPFQSFEIGLLNVLVLPFDNCLRAQLFEVLEEFALPLVAKHTVRDLFARLIEAKRLLGAHRFELENLVTARGAQWRGNVP